MAIINFTRRPCLCMIEQRLPTRIRMVVAVQRTRFGLSFTLDQCSPNEHPLLDDSVPSEASWSMHNTACDHDTCCCVLLLSSRQRAPRSSSFPHCKLATISTHLSRWRLARRTGSRVRPCLCLIPVLLTEGRSSNLTGNSSSR